MSAYWLKKDKEGGYPADFHRALADAGWLGICIPGIWRLGPRHYRCCDHDANNHEVSSGMSGAVAVHMNVFRLNPVVVFSTGSSACACCRRSSTARTNRVLR